MNIPDPELNALLTLIDDPDEEIFAIIRRKILSLGPGIVPVLENAWENQFDNEVQHRIENLIHEIQFGEIRDELIAWRLKPNADLLEGAFLLARFQYPDLDVEGLKEKLRIIIDDARAELNPELSPMEKIKVLNHVIYDIHGFRGNKKNFHAPQNSYINDVIQTRKGNPLSLSIVYSHIARQLGVPIHGVNLPEHFIMAYVDSGDVLDAQSADIPFYVNAFNRGAIFTRNEIELFIRQMKIEPEDRYFLPCGNEQIILRMLHNLVSAYDKLGYPDKIRELQELISAFK